MRKIWCIHIFAVNIMYCHWRDVYSWLNFHFQELKRIDMEKTQFEGANANANDVYWKAIKCSK